jgi:hypothetical protein
MVQFLAHTVENSVNESYGLITAESLRQFKGLIDNHSLRCVGMNQLVHSHPHYESVDQGHAVKTPIRRRGL